jgi:hypothetical protein
MSDRALSAPVPYVDVRLKQSRFYEHCSVSPALVSQKRGWRQGVRPPWYRRCACAICAANWTTRLKGVGN